MTKMVNSWNEWDPLKRVILGRPEGAQAPGSEPGWKHDCPGHGFPEGRYGKFPKEMVDAAAKQMDNFAEILEDEGVTVDRVEVPPNMMDVQSYRTPDWTQLNPRGFNNPRDLFLPVGNEIMEAPGSLRQRWFEYLALRPIFEKYFKKDPEFLWTSAPKPRLTDESYEDNYYHKYDNVWSIDEKRKRLKDWNFQLTEKEPLWDAADAARFGKDIFWLASSVTNRSGVDWLKRYFGNKGIRVHKIQFLGEILEPPWDEYFLHPWHIDINLLPLRPGLAMINPDSPIYTEEAKKLFEMNDWELIKAARPTYEYPDTLSLLEHSGAGLSWISMNTLSLDPNTVCVEAHETKYIKQLEKLGFDVISVPYDKVVPFGGALHCTTLDVKRKGELEDYFPEQIEGY